MALSTQASQLRLYQRPSDAGTWTVPDVYIEESSPDTPDEWVDASEWFEVAGCALSSTGGIVQFSYLARRTAESEGSIYRLVFREREDTISLPQVVGQLAVVSTDQFEEEIDRTWAIYPLVGTTESRLEVIQPYSKLWPTPQVGDVIQFYGTWFI